MDYEAVIASGINHLAFACDFQRLFHNAEHTIVDFKRDFYPNGWGPVDEWISRAHLYDRYVVWLTADIEIASDGTPSPLDSKPSLYIVEIEKVIKSRDEDGPEWEVGWLQFEDDDWYRLVQNNGDFASLEFEMTRDAPVDRFDTFWHDTRPRRGALPPDGLALRAPLRFML